MTAMNTAAPMSTVRFPDAVPPLSGPGVSLRAITEADLPAWFARATDAESADLAGDPIPTTIDEGHALLARNRERFAQRTGIRWAIVPAGQTDSVGTIGLAITPGLEHAAEIGFVIGRAHWGQGLCSAAGRRVLRYAFDTLGLAVVRAEVLHRNLASRRVLEKLGFEIERHLPGDPASGGEAEDCFVYRLAAGASDPASAPVER